MPKRIIWANFQKEILNYKKVMKISTASFAKNHSNGVKWFVQMIHVSQDNGRTKYAFKMKIEIFLPYKRLLQKKIKRKDKYSMILMKQMLKYLLKNNRVQEDSFSLGACLLFLEL